MNGSSENSKSEIFASAGWVRRATPLGTPAYGFYYGFGLEWRDVVPHVNIGIDLHYDDGIACGHLLPTDPLYQQARQLLRCVWGGIAKITYHSALARRCPAVTVTAAGLVVLPGNGAVRGTQAMLRRS